MEMIYKNIDTNLNLLLSYIFLVAMCTRGIIKTLNYFLVSIFVKLLFSETEAPFKIRRKNYERKKELSSTNILPLINTSF